MSTAIDGTAIDKVLQEAVDSGGVPHVAAIAADRDGVIYQGAAGPREAGQSDPVTVDTMFRIMSMTGLDGDTPILRPPARQATVKNLITHTAGFGYWFWSERLVRWQEITGVSNVVAGSAASFT